PQRDHLIAGAEVALNPDGANREEDGEGLPDLIVEAGRADLLDVDVVGPAENLEVGTAHLAQDPDGEARPREGVTTDHLLRQSQLAPYLPYLVLEELAERLQQLERQPLGQPPHVVVGLDGDRRTSPR